MALQRCRLGGYEAIIMITVSVVWGLSECINHIIEVILSDIEAYISQSLTP